MNPLFFDISRICDKYRTVVDRRVPSLATGYRESAMEMHLLVSVCHIPHTSAENTLYTHRTLFGTPVDPSFLRTSHIYDRYRIVVDRLAPRLAAGDREAALEMHFLACVRHIPHTCMENIRYTYLIHL